MRYHERSKQLDRKMQENAVSNSNGKAAVKALILPVLGGRTYEAVRASTGGRSISSRGAAYATAFMTGPFGASAARAIHVRRGEGGRVDQVIDGTKKAVRNGSREIINGISKYAN